jgi:hypothetical protein
VSDKVSPGDNVLVVLSSLAATISTSSVESRGLTISKETPLKRTEGVFKSCGEVFATIALLGLAPSRSANVCGGSGNAYLDNENVEVLVAKLSE